MLAIAAAILAGVVALPGCDRSDRSVDMQYLRALPYAGGVPVDHDLPVGVIRHDVGRTCPGYNLYTLFALGRADLIDAAGNIVLTWSEPGTTWMHAELLPRGDLLVVGAGAAVVTADGRDSHLDDATRFVARYDLHGALLWKRPHPGHHDLDITPTGQLLLLGQRYCRIPAIARDLPVKDDLLMLLDPGDGRVVATRSVMEAIGNRDAAFPLYRGGQAVAGERRFVDLLHGNSVQWMPWPELVGTHPLYGTDNVLVCFRHQNRVAMFDWRRQEVVWSWGRNRLSGPHDAQVLADGDILVFDNGLGQRRSRLVEVDPRSERIVWQYEADPPESFYTVSKGSVQRLPNGNTLAAESDRGRAFEITPDGEIVWEFVCPYRTPQGLRAAIGKIRRYPEAFVAEILAQPEP